MLRWHRPSRLSEEKNETDRGSFGKNKRTGTSMLIHVQSFSEISANLYPVGWVSLFEDSNAWDHLRANLELHLLIIGSKIGNVIALRSSLFRKVFPPNPSFAGSQGLNPLLELLLPPAAGALQHQEVQALLIRGLANSSSERLAKNLSSV